MSMDKKQAAHQAAAKYSTNPSAAFVEYGKLTEQIDPLFTFEKSNNEHRNTIDELKQEMLGLIKKYRHPTNDEFAEHMIFIDPDTPNIDGRANVDPDFLDKIRKENIPADILVAIEEYVKKAELSKIELEECKHELEELKETFRKASCIYKKNGYKSSGERNTATVQALGLSTGRRQKEVNKKKVYVDYLRLVRKEGIPRQNAVKKVQELHGIQSYDATLKTLYDYRASHIRKWKEQCSSPETLSRMKKWLKDFIPGRPKDRG